MNSKQHHETISFSSKGQIVIPARLRKEFQIAAGSKAIVEATDEGILLRPITSHAINRLRGILAGPEPDRTFAEEWAEHKRRERALENRD